MKKILLLICIVSFSISVAAQASESFDVATFKVPKGWDRQAGPSPIQFSTSNDPDYCLITLYKAVPGLDVAKGNFDAAWGTIVKETVNVSTAPQMADTSVENGWEIHTGYAPFEKEGLKGVAMLVTASGFGKMVNALILTNTQNYESTITAFLGSISLKKLETIAKPPVEVNTGSSGGLSVTSHHWKQTQNRKDSGGYAGYSSNMYQIIPNNTYKFSQVTFQNYAPKYYVEDEEGTYKITGRTITLVATKSIFRTHKSSREDPVLKTGKLELTTLAYNFEFMNLNDNWTLLLSPVNGVETKRDGGFSFWLEGEKRRTYTYNSVSGNGNLLNAAGQVR